MNAIVEIGYYDGGLFMALWSANRDINVLKTVDAGRDLFIRLSGGREMPITRCHARALIAQLEG